MIAKEALQLRRDKPTFAMMLLIPIMQLVLFGFAINLDPKQLTTAVLVSEQSPLARSLLTALTNTGYFAITREPATETEADELLQRGEVQFVIYIPPNLTRKLVRGERPQIVVEADATDPVTTGPALNAVSQAINQSLERELQGPLASLIPRMSPVDLILHKRYNPESVTRYNLVPGLLAMILTMTMVMMTSLAVTRERERGTMENLIAMPIQPIQVMVGKITPYILIGAVQVTMIVLAGRLIFDVPFFGSLTLFALSTLLYIVIDLAIGFTISTIAKNPLQATQMSTFFFLPTFMISGFAFPFSGMPSWAQLLGELLPSTHYLRIVRSVMLKGATSAQLSNELAALGLTLVIVVAVAISRYRVTLD
jgi:ABC-2 type transport system permease protein